MRTAIGVNDPQAVKKWSTALGVAVNKSSYFARKMMGMGKDSASPFSEWTSWRAMQAMRSRMTC